MTVPLDTVNDIRSMEAPDTRVREGPHASPEPEHGDKVRRHGIHVAQDAASRIKDSSISTRAPKPERQPTTPGACAPKFPSPCPAGRVRRGPGRENGRAQSEKERAPPGQPDAV